MDKELQKDIIEWDISNWTRAIEFWDGYSGDLLAEIRNAGETPKVLDIGAKNGGMSLYWALKGCDVLWTDLLDDGLESAKQLHEKYNVSDRISYETMNSLEIPYENQFDIVCFKSVWGAVYSAAGGEEAARRMVDQICKALKPGGCLFFAENLAGNNMHQFLRKKLSRWWNVWHYFTLDEIFRYLGGFEILGYDTFGVVGVFGRVSFLNRLFGAIDRAIDHKIPEKNRYIISAVCQKPENSR